MGSFLKDKTPQPATRHNVDIELALKFFADLTVNATGEANLLPSSAVPRIINAGLSPKEA